MISPVLLNTFCTLVELGHFTRTAEQLHMTQSGVSQHIRKLEALLGQTLIIRQGKQFRLNQVGQAFYQRSKGVLASLASLEASVKQDSAHEGEIRIMSPGSVGLRLYPKLLALQQRYPDLVIDYRFAPNDTIEAHLNDAKLEIGLMTKLASQERIQSQLVAEEALLLVTPANWQDTQKDLAPDDLAPGDLPLPSWQALQALGFIQHPDSAYQAALLLGANYRQFTHINEIKKSGFSNQINAILEPVSLGLGFTVLPAFAVEAFKDQEAIQVHHLPKAVHESLHLCCHRQPFEPKRVRFLKAEIQAWLAH